MRTINVNYACCMSGCLSKASIEANDLEDIPECPDGWKIIYSNPNNTFRTLCNEHAEEWEAINVRANAERASFISKLVPLDKR